MNSGESSITVDSNPKRLTPSTQIGSYRIECQIGEGGMGTVYRALDTKLNRPVAIKFLSNELADAVARRRFQREAQTASSLNHPHILTVHDAGEFESRQYLVTELVDGGTLKDWATAEKRTWRQIVELLVGVADGLAAAHAAGITHRDIKPTNILVARNGYAKLVDFGLAKLTEGAALETTNAQTTEGTRAGLIVGTVAYMSPEQASGRQVDARSDIFSFGIVLYELLAGWRPFAGAAELEVLKTIIHGAPQPLADDLPAAIRAVVEKALEKDPSDRYQSMREMVVDLRRLGRLTGDSSSATAGRVGRAGSGGNLMWIATAAGVAALLAAGVVVFRSRTPAAPARPEYTQLTNFADSATSPALSPDGRMLAFIRGEGTFTSRGQIYVKLLPNGEPVQLTNDDLNKMGPRFSPDGARIAYTSVGRASRYETWVVPVLGGQPRLFLANAEGLTWIGAGAGQPRLLFSEMTGRGNQMAIVSSTESRTEQRTVYLPPESGMAHRSYLSPDRKQVLVVEMGFNGAWLPCRLVAFDGSFPAKPVGPPAQCTDASWSPDGKWMYFSTNTGGGFHIWRQRVPDGTPEQVTSGVTQEEGIEFAPDGRSFVTSIGTSQSTVWVHDSRGDRQITSEGYGFLPSISPDGRKLYYVVRAGGARNFVSGELWVADLESGQRQRLLPDFLMQHYAVSADGQRVVFVVADDTGKSPVWLAALNGRSAPRRVTATDAWKAYFGASNDVLFVGEGDGAKVIYRVKEDGSPLQQVTRTASGAVFIVSPDGKWVLVSNSTDEPRDAMMLYPVAGGSPRMICERCTSGSVDRPGPSILSWSPDRKFLYFNFRRSVYAIPLRPGQMLPPLPATGLSTEKDIAALPGARLIPQQEAFAGPNPSVYAFTKVATQRNIYRVPVP
ncbi:MAG: protein kinase domain-containing protein [Vicinamibacterales bacterium]